MLRYGQTCNGEWLYGHLCSVKYQSVHPEVLFLRCGMVYRLICLIGGAARCSYGHSLTDGFPESIEANGKLLLWNLGKQVQGLALSGEGWWDHFPLLREVSNLKGFVYNKSVDMSRRESRHFFKIHVGISSILHCLFRDRLISFLMSPSDRCWK